MICPASQPTPACRPSTPCCRAWSPEPPLLPLLPLLLGDVAGALRREPEHQLVELRLGEARAMQVLMRTLRRLQIDCGTGRWGWTQPWRAGQTRKVLRQLQALYASENSTCACLVYNRVVRHGTGESAEHRAAQRELKLGFCLCKRRDTLGAARFVLANDGAWPAFPLQPTHPHAHTHAHTAHAAPC